MSGKVIHAGTLIGCPHGGRVGVAPAPSPGVLLDGRPVAGSALVHPVTGCRHTVDGIPRPCVGVRWSPAADGVLVDGAPLLLESTQGMCHTAAGTPQGPPVVVGAAHREVACG
ncbi:hypothetical protein [Streptomyces sp. NPDC014894]|uniref:hypothetical protein n=1 Tax=unclassified Streptomyces TaxID=2593676 RepID=UPI0036F7AD16